MFYKVIKNDKVIDVLDRLVFLKYQKKHGRMLLCDKKEAQAILSSDGKTMWNTMELRELPIPGYDIVTIEEIDRYDYERLKALNCGTIEDVIDEFVLTFVANDMDMLVESLKRLYIRQAIDEKTVVDVCNAYRITEEKCRYILEK